MRMVTNLTEMKLLFAVTGGISAKSEKMELKFPKNTCKAKML